MALLSQEEKYEHLNKEIFMGYIKIIKNRSIIIQIVCEKEDWPSFKKGSDKDGNFCSSKWNSFCKH